MTAKLSVSLVVVSRDRPELLLRCLTAIGQLQEIEFELIVVSNSSKPDCLRGQFRHVCFAQANIAAARNEGVRAGNGDIVAFCDDDAVPEPFWLKRLVAPFDNDGVGAAGGQVLGRNGVTYYWNAPDIDCCANELAVVRLAGIQPGSADRAMVTLGTNCAFRRRALVELGGFDVAFRYFLDEADLNWRLARAGWLTEFVPNAVVHHGSAPNMVRKQNRAPTSWFEVSASKVVFLRKHWRGDIAPIIAEYRKERRAKAISAFNLGMLNSGDLTSLNATMENGVAEGMRRRFGIFEAFSPAGTPTRMISWQKAQSVAICVGPFGLWRGRRTARDLVSQGKLVSLICFWRNAMALSARFEKAGYWFHQGGVYRRGDRTGAQFQVVRRKTKFTRELARIADQRSFDIVTGLS